MVRKLQYFIESFCDTALGATEPTRDADADQLSLLMLHDNALAYANMVGNMTVIPIGDPQV